MEISSNNTQNNNAPQSEAAAQAFIYGGRKYPNIRGRITFTPFMQGTVVGVSVTGLPQFSRENGQIIGPHGFHLHNGSSCSVGTSENPFPDSGTHYNPDNQPHANHAGDFPVLFSNNGQAHMNFYTDRFTPDQIIGMVAVIHEQPDDYRTQPTGNSGEKIACGVIRKTT